MKVSCLIFFHERTTGSIHRYISKINKCILHLATRFELTECEILELLDDSPKARQSVINGLNKFATVREIKVFVNLVGSATTTQEKYCSASILDDLINIDRKDPIKPFMDAGIVPVVMKALREWDEVDDIDAIGGIIKFLRGADAFGHKYMIKFVDEGLLEEMIRFLDYTDNEGFSNPVGHRTALMFFTSIVDDDFEMMRKIRDLPGGIEALKEYETKENDIRELLREIWRLSPRKVLPGRKIKAAR